MAKQKNPRKQGGKKRRYIRSKSTKPDKKKKKPAKKTQASTKDDRANNNLKFRNKLLSQVSKFYKERDDKDRLDRSFLNARTAYLFKVLKSSAPDGIITNQLFKQFSNNLENIVRKPATTVLKPDDIGDTAIQIDYWNLEHFIEQHKDELDQYKNVSISMASILGAGYDQDEESIDDLDILGAIRDVKRYAIRENEKDSSQFLFFNILKSKDNESLIFELVDTELDDKVRMIDGELEPVEIPEYEPEKGKKKTKKGEKEKEKPAVPEKEEKPEKLSAAEKAAIERENKKGELELLKSKKESFQQDIAFNNKQITEIAGVIKVLKDIDVDFTDEKQQILDYQRMNRDLQKDIEAINKRIKDL